jgi:hypothetical protein
VEIRHCLPSFDAESFVFHCAIQKYNIKIHTTTILPVVLYGCETWSLRLREERRLKLFENCVWKKIFGPKRDEVTEEWRKLNNEELIDLYSSTNIVKNEMGWACRMYGREERHIQ